MSKVNNEVTSVEAPLASSRGKSDQESGTAWPVSLSACQGLVCQKKLAAPSRIGAAKRANQATSRERAMARAAYKQRGISSISLSGNENEKEKLQVPVAIAPFPIRPPSFL